MLGVWNRVPEVFEAVVEVLGKLREWADGRSPLCVPTELYRIIRERRGSSPYR